MLFLHGIFGSGVNWRGFARRLVNAWARARPRLGAVLVDLRQHGASQGAPPPHTLAAAAADLSALRPHLPAPVTAVLGHSFGGKVALSWLLAGADVADAWIIDSTPSARPDARGSESTLRVLAALRALPRSFPTRAAFVQALTDQGHEPALAQWLAMNLEAAAGGFTLRLDLDAIGALLDDYFARDLWAAVPPPGRARVHLVAGGRSAVLSPDDLARARALGDRVTVDVLPQAGHFVHVDDADGLLRLMLESEGVPADL